ncbi:L-ribulose-5-phosphate 4-epimerase AraD [Ponticoccus alexandrii]|uniref:L-ribulose-5-phosphate 4-epimerase n=1 Tax=Ponticoccus alexandrii TaxID=1943633 RepID=A0ABX7FFB1_9RHOB|nr:L-ribulose-5-phosphate 4-epimerase AraD [Ponticoccus alexandrii]ETA51854.1 ribulose 5-phosphate epimerase [Rhodobacteraceae bacterium PD-2]QRF69185.1 L-ribulose-5-phosphate 4-epimerase AraD [Ponticoccus alexandrii]
MPLDALKSAALEANLDTVRHGLVKATFGNASGIDRASGRIVIKPSGVPYPEMTADHMVLTDLDGAALDNRFRPSSDLDTHVALYRAFPQIGGIVHTHSTYATIMAQARRPIPPLGTTHADYFRGTIPVTRDLTAEEITTRYVAATGEVIAETVGDGDPLAIPAALVAGHGPFVWGRDPAEAVMNAMILEEVAKMAWHGAVLDARPPAISDTLLDRHFLRKHGANATYGQ